MTEAELDELLNDCPVLFHMAQRGSWPSIRKHGLLSTTALLDALDVPADVRKPIESERRAESISLARKEFGRAVIRDQKPMDDRGLVRCLQDGLTAEEWYRLLNNKVFFWLTRDRLLRLLNADAYRDQEHDVLEIDARALVTAHRDAISLCPMNSGCTKPMPHPRGKGTFARIEDYPYSSWRTKRRRGERVVELAVDDGVLDIARYVQRVKIMRGNRTTATIWSR